MRVLVTKNPLKRRLPYIEHAVDGILMYGKDNLYPQRMAELLNRSGTAKACVKLFGKFVRGAGFKDANLNKAIVNEYRQTAKDLLWEAVQDYRIHNGFALHVDYNAFLQPVNPKVIKFEHCRLGVPDENGHITKIVVSDDWPNEKNKSTKKRQRVDVFNPDPEVVLKQIERAKGLANYAGQILYVTENVNQYPTCTFDEIVADVETDAKISVFRETSVNNKFMADHIVEYPGEFESEKDKQAIEKTLTDFQGVDKSGRFMLLENPHAADKPIAIHKIDIQNTDRLFEWTDQSAQTKIRKNFTQPAILVGDLIPGRLGNTQEIENSFTFYNAVTYDDRDLVGRAFGRVLPLIPGLNAVDTSIKPLTWSMFLEELGSVAPEAQEQPTGPKLTIGDLNKVLKIANKYKNGQLTEAEALVVLAGYGFTEDEAKVFLADAADGNLDGE